MLSHLAWIANSKSATIGGAILGGSGLLTLIFGLHENVTANIEKAEVRSKQYVQLKLEPFEREINNIEKDLVETKDMVKDIHKYLLEKKEN